MCFAVLAGKQPEMKNQLSLVFPLKDGTYYISSGGSTSAINNHFRPYPNSQQFAIDINMINSTGNAASSFITGYSKDHFIFGQEIFCPCEGEVVDAMNDVPDNPTSDMTVDHTFGRGNYIDIRCDDLIISMSHLLEGSILPKVGDLLSANQKIGQVGNSGFSMEPHLHIQAAWFLDDSVLVGVPVNYNDRWLVRNDLFRN